MARQPASSGSSRTWQDLPLRDRRRIMRAVNRGAALEDRREAAMAVQVARRQQAFWKWAWLLGPVTAAFWFPQGWLTVLGYGAASTLMVGALSWWRLTRARRAEERNLEVASSSGRARRVRAHVPGRRDREASRVVATNEPVHNPPKPSRRKRRGRG